MLRLPYKSVLCARAEDRVLGEPLLATVAQKCAEIAATDGDPEALRLAAVFERASAQKILANEGDKPGHARGGASDEAAEAREFAEAQLLAANAAEEAAVAAVLAAESAGAPPVTVRQTRKVTERAVRRAVRRRFANLEETWRCEAVLQNGRPLTSRQVRLGLYFMPPEPTYTVGTQRTC